MVAPRSSAPLGYTPSTTVAVVIIALVAMFAFLTPTAFALGDENNAIVLSITAQNSASTDGLIQFHIKTNTSLTSGVQFRLTDLTTCPITSGYLFSSPWAGWDSVGYHGTCATKAGYIEDFSMSYGSGCQLSFDFEHLDAQDEIVCFMQWNQAISTSPAALVNFTLNPDYSSDARLTLAAPVQLRPPMTWDVVPAPSYTLGNMTVKLVQGKDLLWAGAPKDMTKDKIVLSFANATLEPFSQYELNTLRIYKDGSSLFNVLSRMDEYQAINAYVAKDVRMWARDGDYYILTGANPAATFDIEIVFSNFLAQYYANGAFTMASVDEQEDAAHGGEEQADRTTTSRSHRRGGAKRQRRSRAAKHHTAEDLKALFEQRQQQHLSTLAASPHKVLQSEEYPLTIFARVSRLDYSQYAVKMVAQQTSASTENVVEATSNPIKEYKYFELFPDFLSISAPSFQPQDNTTVALATSFTFFTRKENYTMEIAMDGYEGGFKNAQELMMYYGNAAKLVYSCGDGDVKPFNITSESITGFCVRDANTYSNPYIAALIPAAKALKPFKIPITIDGRKTHFQFIPPHTTAWTQPFTKFTNTEFAFNITTTFATQVELSYDNVPIVLEVDTSVMFTTPVVYQLNMNNPQYLVEETLRCTAYNNNGNTKFSMTPHTSMSGSIGFFKDKKVDVKAKAGDSITITCTAPLNPNPKDGSKTVGMYVRTIMTDQYASLERDETVTTPNEDWLEESSDRIVFDECLAVYHLMSPAPKTMDEAKQRIIKLLKTAQLLGPIVEAPVDFVATATAAVGEQVDILAGLKNITTKDVYIEWFMSPMHEAPKTSALTAANGLDKVLEFNKKFSGGHAFSGDEDRMFFWASVNTTAAPGFSSTASQIRFTAANGEEGFSLYSNNNRNLPAGDDITTLNTNDPTKTLPQWGADQGWACSTVAQCDGPCVNGKCQYENLPIIWSVLDMYWVGDKFTDMSDLVDQVKAADNTREQNNAAFAVGAGGYYAVAMAVVAVVAMIF